MDETAGDSGTGTTAASETEDGATGDPTGGAGASGSDGESSGSPGGSGTDTGETTDAGGATDTQGGTDDGGLVCTSEYDPVCGVDGETYDHPCSAMAAGVEIKRDGPCFGDCEGSCSVGSSPLTLAFALVAVVCLRPRRRSGRIS